MRPLCLNLHPSPSSPFSPSPNVAQNKLPHVALYTLKAGLFFRLEQQPALLQANELPPSVLLWVTSRRNCNLKVAAWLQEGA